MDDDRLVRKIAVLLPDLRAGGAELQSLRLAEEWIGQGIEVTFVLRRAQGELLETVSDEITIVDLKATRVRNALVPLVHFLKRADATALLVAMWPLTALAPMAAKLAGYRGRVVISEHSPLSIAYKGRGGLHRLALRTSMRLAYPMADARIAVSSGVADDLAQLSGMRRGNFEIIHNPVIRGNRRAISTPCPSLIENVERPLILAVGTLKKVKRFDLLIEAFSRLPIDAVLCILGEGPARPELEQLIEMRGIQNSVLMPGFIADPGPWYAQADLFVLCSDYEGFGNVIVEAMEHGVPIVSTDCPFGPREILCDGRYGRLTPVGDASALANAIQETLRVERNAEALKLRALDFSVERIAKRYLGELLPHGDNAWS